MRRLLTLTALTLLGSLLFAEPTQAQCGLFGGLFAGARARQEARMAYSQAAGCYSAGYGAACYGQSYEAYGASCYGQSYTGATYAAPARPVRRLLGGIFAPRRVAYVSAPSNAAMYYYPAPAPASGVGGYAGSTPAYYGYGYSDSGYVNPGSPGVYPPSWQAANCPNGICPMPPTPGKATPQTPTAPSVPPPAPLPPSGPATGHHVGNGCPCGDKACTHGAGLCPCANPKCICAHVGGGRFPR